MILQRISEMVASLPFLPFAMILSALIGNTMDHNQKSIFDYGYIRIFILAKFTKTCPCTSTFSSGAGICNCC